MPEGDGRLRKQEEVGPAFRIDDDCPCMKGGLLLTYQQAGRS